MEQQDAKVENSRGVRFEGVKIGQGCAVTIVSTKGEAVYGKNIEVEDYTSFNSGQMSDASVQSLPKAYCPEQFSTGNRSDQSSTENQSGRVAEFSRHGVGRVVGVAASNGACAERPT